MQYQLILASKSPRRKDLLAKTGLDFEIRTKDTEEVYPSDLQLDQVPEYLANLKASAFDNELKENEILIAADTVVILNDKIIGKPKNYDEALAFLKELNGSVHEVITGLSIKSFAQQSSFSEMTKVWFSKLSDQTLERYITEKEPYDKAGAYAIQEWIGFVGIEKIEGNYPNVLGLPVYRLLNELKKFNISMK